ncbi:MAG TPA: sigma-70 family RNA polymerase sigma factor [Thermoanaerobaculia bacterium]|nr:sigma-70 family RNA polymerase sigma factor [Thermoanaerobaculia bacterium]
MTAEAILTHELDTPAPKRTQSDSAVLAATIRAAQSGDDAAFEDLMRLSERRVALLAWRILGDGEETKDAVQDVFLRVYRHLGRFDARHEFAGWLFRITVNVCRDLRKKRRKRAIFTPIDAADDVADAVQVDDDLATRRDVVLLTRAIDALPEKERLAVILRDIEELSTEQVASILGNSAATVRVQISKARVKLRQWIAEWRKGSGS